MMTKLFALCFLFLARFCRAEIFSSMDQLTQLPQSISQLPKYLDTFLKIQEDKLFKAKKIVDMLELNAIQANVDPKKFMSNPVNSFLAIKMLTKDLEAFFDYFNPRDEWIDVIKQIETNLVVPSQEDYKGSITALIRLEDAYLLTPAEVRMGKFGSSNSLRPLNAFECFEFGRIAQENDDHFHAIRWFNEALKLTEIEGKNFSLRESVVLDYLSFSLYKQGNLYQSLEINKKLVEMEPDNQKFKQNLEFYSRALAEQLISKFSSLPDLSAQLKDLIDVEVKNERLVGYSGSEKEAYEKLCREPNPQTIVNRRLKCRYVNSHPMLIIAPIKAEQAHEEPPIWVYHDVITEYQANEMIRLARPKLDRARVSSEGEDGRGKVSNIRISKNGWLEETDAPFLSYLTKLVTAVTGLNLEFAEKWQMNNYGLGGVYEPHEDFSHKRDADKWDHQFGFRIATWMFYIEAPEMGGATVFPRIGARVHPVNRSAVFWYNMLPSGEGDFRTRHAACPVLVGSKWVSNKWIRAKGQELIRLCGLHYEENESYLNYQ